MNRSVCFALLSGWVAAATAQTLDQAFDAYERADFAVALPMFQDLAEAGDAGAAFYLGRMYDTGRGAPEDDVEAVRWYRLAAERGHRAAQFSLGVKHAAGEGVEKDPAQAARWFESSARLGYPSAQFNLGTLYATGDGVSRDPVAAYAWWHLAAERGNLMARDNRDRLRPSLDPEQLRRAEQMATDLLDRQGAGS